MCVMSVGCSTGQTGAIDPTVGFARHDPFYFVCVCLLFFFSFFLFGGREVILFVVVVIIRCA